MPKSSKVLVVTLLALPAFNCGGGGGGGPAADFCREYAAAECKKIYECPDPNVTVTGTEAQCVAGLTQLCIAPPSGGVDSLCAGDKQINEAARRSCLDSFTSVSCADYNSGNFTNVCDQVCVTPTPGGAGGSSGGGGGGSGGPSGTGGSGVAPTSPTAGIFWANFSEAVCSRAYACFTVAERDAAFQNSFGTTIDECRLARASLSETVVSLCTAYSAANGNACVSKTIAVTCDAFKTNQTPAECALACPEPASP